MLHLSNNLLESLAGIGSYPQLTWFSCSDNQLTSVTEIELCSPLIHFRCCNNLLETLAGIEQCPLLEVLNCSDNQLQMLDQIVYLRYLRVLNYDNNPLGIQTVQTQRAIDRIRRVNTQSSIYADGQNVHDTHIQKTVCESLQRLLKDPAPVFSIQELIDSDLDKYVVRVLIRFCKDKSVHSVHLLTYAELLAYVWNRIKMSEHKIELLKILEEQVLDAEHKCFTGRFNRTLSVLVGFYPDIVIEIADSSRIGAIILAQQNSIRPYDPVQHRRLAHDALTEAGYGQEQIQEWLEAISEDPTEI